GSNGDPIRIFVFGFDSSTAGRVYVGTGFGLASSENSGATWRNEQSAGSEIRDLAVSRDTPWIVWAGTPVQGVIRADYARYPSLGSAVLNPGLSATAIGSLAV